MKTVKIVVKDSKLPVPTLYGISTNAVNGDVTIHWTPTFDPNGIFKKHYIYYKTGLYFPWQLLDSVNLVSQTQYTHIGANGNVQPLWYKIKTRSGCSGKNLSNFSNELLSPLAQLYMGIGQNIQTEIQVSAETESGAQNLICYSPAAGQLIIQIMDPSGRIITGLTEPVSGGYVLNRITLPDLRPGVYLFSAILNNYRKNGKFVVPK